MTCGMAWAWMGVGTVYSARVNAARIGADRPKEAKSFMWRTDFRDRVSLAEAVGAVGGTASRRRFSTE